MIFLIFMILFLVVINPKIPRVRISPLCVQSKVLFRRPSRFDDRGRG